MKFVIYTDAEGKTRWKLVAKNGKIVADSGEGYHSEGNARRAIKSWRNHFDVAYLTDWEVLVTTQGTLGRAMVELRLAWRQFWREVWK